IIFQPHDRIGALVYRVLTDPVNISNNDGYTVTALDAYMYDDEKWGYPAVTDIYRMYYNKSLVDEATETMEEVMDIAEENTDASKDEFGFLMESDNFYYVYPFFAGFGSYVFENNDGNYDIDDIGLDNEGAIEGGELIQS